MMILEFIYSKLKLKEYFIRFFLLLKMLNLKLLIIEFIIVQNLINDILYIGFICWY
jgi:hypothetical protein